MSRIKNINKRVKSIYRGSKLIFSDYEGGTLFQVIGCIGMPARKLPGKRRDAKPRESVEAMFHDRISLRKFLFQF